MEIFLDHSKLFIDYLKLGFASINSFIKFGLKTCSFVLKLFKLAVLASFNVLLLF